MDFKEHLKKYLSDEEINNLVKSFNNKEQKGVLLNTNKLSIDNFLKLFPEVKPHPVVDNAFLFDEDKYPLGKKIYHELGAYYIQDPSAMLVAHFLKPKDNQRILDLCAAPGGKTVGTSLLMHNKGIIYANDISSSRSDILLSNVERMGLGNVVVLNKDFSRLGDKLSNYFDAIILDAPCSGSGMFRKLEAMKDDWTYEKVLKYSAIQKELILLASKMLKEGGMLLYSTCSYSYEEDEEVVKYLLENSEFSLDEIEHFDGEYRSKEFPECVHLFPSIFTGEGHFIARLKKNGKLSKNTENNIVFSRKKLSKGNKPQLDKFEVFLDPNEYLISIANRPGLFISSKIGNDEIYSHHYSHYLDASSSIELSKEEVIKYMRGESLYKKDIPDGYNFVSYMGMNIGVTHVVNTTLKNLYPKGLRINASIDSSF